IRVLLDRIRSGDGGPSFGSQRGEGRFKAITYTVILVAALYAAFKLVPIYIAEYELVDKMQEQARYAVVNRSSEDKIRDIIFKEIEDLEIPAKREDIKVSSTMQVVKITVDYTVPVDLLFYHMDLHFTPSSENKALF
ncbi:MAG: hypothetical protein ACRD36_08260, partial [Candidatus Acidiferrum sp.]